MTQNPIQQRVDQYYQTKPADDVDLVAIVRQELINAGLGQRLEFFNSNRFVIEAEGKPSEVQRYLMNRYWSQQLMAAEHSAIEERWALIPNGLIIDWITLFQGKVMPFVVANNLPVAI